MNSWWWQLPSRHRPRSVPAREERACTPPLRAAEWRRCLTARDVGVCILDRDARLGLFVGRYQQFIREICLCLDKASFTSCADRYQRAFKRRGRTISPETKCGE